MNDNEKKLKLCENEIVQAETFELACKVCELADSLEINWEIDECCSSFLDRILWNKNKENTCYDFNDRVHGSKQYYKLHDYKIISAVEWLNRHDIFVYGQNVWFGITSDRRDRCNRDERIYIDEHTLVTKSSEKGFYDKTGFATVNVNYIISPFLEWKSEPDMVRFVLGDKETMISVESAEAIGKLLK